MTSSHQENDDDRCYLINTKWCKTLFLENIISSNSNQNIV